MIQSSSKRDLGSPTNTNGNPRYYMFSKCAAKSPLQRPKQTRVSDIKMQTSADAGSPMTMQSSSPTLKSMRHPKLNYSSSYKTEYTQQTTGNQLVISDMIRLREQPKIKSQAVFQSTTNKMYHRKPEETDYEKREAPSAAKKRLPMVCPSSTYKTQYFNWGSPTTRINQPTQFPHTFDLPMVQQSTYAQNYSPMQSEFTLSQKKLSKLKLGPLDFLLTQQKQLPKTPFEIDQSAKRPDQLFSSNTPTFKGQFVSEKNRQYLGHVGFAKELPAEIPSNIKIFYFSREYKD